MTSIYWIQHDRTPRIAIVARPRGEDWLQDDLIAMKSSGIDVLVSLLENDEAIELGLEKESELAQRVGMEFISFPIADRTIPENRQKFCKLISYLSEVIHSGKHIGAHCRGCIGRATILTASLMVELGFEAADALRLIEESRGCTVPDTDAQRRWILHLTRCSQS